MKKIKFVLSILIILIALNFCTYSMADTNCKLYIEEAIKYQNSDEVTVNICMEDINSEIVTLLFEVDYDTSKLEFINAKKGKDLNSSMQLAENIPEESKVSIGIVTLGGLEDSGLYYTITFKVKDSSSDIPLKLLINEATNSNGESVNVLSSDGIIKISSETKKEEEKSKENQKIENFEITEIKDETVTLEDYVLNNGNIELSGSDNLVYEIDNVDVLEVSSDGMMIPNKNGKANVRIKLNGQTVGNTEIEVEDGKVSKITGTNEELAFKTEATTENGNALSKIYSSNKNMDANDENSNNENEQETNTTNKFNIKIAVLIIILVITFLFIILKFTKKKSSKFTTKF